MASHDQKDRKAAQDVQPLQPSGRRQLGWRRGDNFLIQKNNPEYALNINGYLFLAFFSRSENRFLMAPVYSLIEFH